MANKLYPTYVNSKMMSQYASLSSAVSAIGATTTVLRINETPSAVSSNLSLPANIYLEWDGSSVISVDSGKTLTLGNAPDSVSRQVFTGLGKVKFAKTAGRGEFLGVWWIPDGSATPQVITQAMWDGMTESLTANYGGTVILPAGTYSHTYEPQVATGRIKGAGGHTGINGTVLIPQSSGQAGFRITPGARMVSIEDLVIDFDGSYTQAGIELRAAYGTDTGANGAIQYVYINNVMVQDGKYGLYLNDTSGLKSYLFNDVVTTSTFVPTGQSDACVYTNSVNTGCTFQSENVTPMGNGTAVGYDLQSIGKCHITGNCNGKYAGNTTPYTSGTELWTFTSSDINTGTDVITKTGHGLYTGDTIYVNSAGSLPGGLALSTVYYVREVSATTITLHPTLADASGNTNKVDITSGGSGTHTAWWPWATEINTIVPGDINTGTDVITKTAHGLSTGDSVYFSANTGGTLPTGISANTKYWVQAVSSSTIKLHDTPERAINAGTVLDISATGSGWFRMWSTRPNAAVADQMPLAAIRLGGNYSPTLTIGPWQDEGMPWFLIADSNAVGGTPQYATTINLQNISTQGQVNLKGGGGRINIYGGQMLADSFKDESDAAYIVRNYGAQPYQYGIGGPVNSFSGMAVPSPYRFDDFQGQSYFANDHNTAEGDMSARAGNDVDIWGVESKNYATSIRLWMKVRRLGSGALAGWWKFRNSLFGLLDSQAGWLFEGGIANNGRVLNARSDAAGAASGTITLDLSLGNHFTGTLNENATLEFTGAVSGYRQLVTFEHVTSGTTSYNLTAGTNVHMVGTFATGTISGVRQTLVFICDGAGTPLLKQIAMPLNAPINAQTGTTYTLVPGDCGKIITLSNASAITVTVPTGLGAGFNCVLVQIGAGQVTFSPSSTTVNNRQSHTKIAGQYGAVGLVAYTATVFVLSGDTAS